MKLIQKAIANRTVSIFAAAVVAVSLPILYAIWEMNNAPVIRADGTIEDGAEKGAYLFVHHQAFPLFFILLAFYFLLSWLPKSGRIASVVLVSAILPTAPYMQELGAGSKPHAVMVGSLFVVCLLVLAVGLIVYELGSSRWFRLIK